MNILGNIGSQSSHIRIQIFFLNFLVRPLYFEEIMITGENSSTLCHLLITFSNSLDPDQARQYVWPDLDPSCLALMIFLKEFFDKLILKKIIRQKSM